MEKKNLNLIVSSFAFVLGAIFVLSYPADVTANVIGASGPAAGTTVVIGLVLVIASAAFFILTINHGDTYLERLVRETKNSEEIKSKVDEHETKEKYEDNK